MREHGETTRSLGAAIGVTSGAVTGWTNGSVPRPEATRRLADYFGVSVEDLVDDARELATPPTLLLEESAPEARLAAAPAKTAAALARRELGDAPAGQARFEQHLANLRALREESERLHPRDPATALTHFDTLLAAYIAAWDTTRQKP